MHQLKVSVIGAGVMGRRLAYTIGRECEFQVMLYSRTQDTLDSALSYIQWQRAHEEGPEPRGPVHITATTELDVAVRDADVVLETIAERAVEKRRLWEKIERLVHKDAILGTNASTLFADEVIGESLRSRACNVHFYKPPHIMAVELMAGAKTDQASLVRWRQVLRMAGFNIYDVRQPSRGFIYNRIWAAVKRETLAILDDGIADPQTIDKLYEEVTGLKIGPCKLMDIVGLDVVRDIEVIYGDTLQDVHTKALKFIAPYIEAGRLGRKSGDGLHSYLNTSSDAGKKAGS
ncbi:3-hydroxybutyryl-CoA dehydrogenase OS=Castellaniella defragrans OX=75697 GN=HNR28_001018 PE=4 SV=1 [Castellaniella defragrans]